MKAPVKLTPSGSEVSMKRTLLFCLLLLGSACSDGVQPSTPASGPSPRLRVVHAALPVQSMDVLVDGRTVIRNLTYGATSAFVVVPSGVQSVLIRPTSGGTVGTPRTVTFANGGQVTMVAVDSASVINPVVLTDTGSTPVPGASKLRVVHFATNAPPISVLRTQPDFPTPISVMFPFAYRAASPYLQSTPGDWEVIVTRENQPDTLYRTGPIAIGSGELRTVVLIDAAAGGIGAVVVDP